MKRGFACIAYLLIFLGLLLMLDTDGAITGAVVGSAASGSGLNIIAGLAFLAFGFLFNATEEKTKKQKNLEEKLKENEIRLRKDANKYYRNRAEEITEHKGDAWVGLWEADKILEELARKGYKIEHGREITAVHSYGTAPILHASIAKKYRGKKAEERKHLYISQNLRDKNIKEQVGFKDVIENGKEKIKRVCSKYYNLKFALNVNFPDKYKGTYTKKIGVARVK